MTARNATARRRPDDVPAADRTLLAAHGYRNATVRQGQVCGVKDFAFTTALMVGIDPFGYTLRYCYEHAADAEAALAQWDGTGHPGGPWIKCKGAGVELLNPLLSC